MKESGKSIPLPLVFLPVMKPPVNHADDYEKSKTDCAENNGKN